VDVDQTMSQAAEGALRFPCVAVLLATHNGREFLVEQIESILAQEGVSVDLWISDDSSSDGTFEYLRDRERIDPRIKLLPPAVFGSAADNFLRLVRDVPIEHYGYVALADQDDVWLSFKLRRAIEQLARSNADGYSSNLTAFDDRSGKEWPVCKSAPPRALDYLFGGASAGCTYVLSVRAVMLLRSRMAGQPAPSHGWSHDWLFHAICRSEGLGWVFDDTAPIRYRQHVGNQYGVRSGLQGVVLRVSNIANGWYRERVLENGKFLSNTPAEAEILLRVERLLLADRLWLSIRGWRLRRQRLDGVALAVAFLLMTRTGSRSADDPNPD
jgi:rhamnosyltransferase